jgi:hypothetical protein
MHRDNSLCRYDCFFLTVITLGLRQQSRGKQRTFALEVTLRYFKVLRATSHML